MLLRSLTILLLAGLCVVADPPKDDAVKKELDKLHGTWKVIKGIKDGHEEDPKGALITITGDKMTIKSPKREEVAKIITVDASKKPATIDIRPEKGPSTVKGIYEIGNDTVKFCFSPKKRPTEFKSESGSNFLLMVLKRDKK